MLYSAQTNGFYSPDIHSTIPDDVVEITNDHHAILLAGQANGQRIIADDEGMPVLANPSAPHLDEIKQSLKNAIDSAAETERLKYITGGAGQAMTYQEKVAQAVSYTKAWLAHTSDPDAMPEPNESEYPLLAAGLYLDGDTLLEVAETVTFAYALWQKIGSAIEATRLLAKVAIEGTADAQEAQMICDAVIWPNPQMLEQMAEGGEADNSGAENGDEEEEGVGEAIS